MTHKVRKHGEYIIIEFEHDRTTIDVGMMDVDEAQAFLAELLDFADSIEYYLPVQEVEGE